MDNSTTIPALVETFASECIARWNGTPTSSPVLTRRYAPTEQRHHAQQLDVLIAEVTRELAQFPQDPCDRGCWRSQIGSWLTTYCQECLGYSTELIETLFTPEHVQVTAAFVRRARRFDPALSWDDLHQALRNVWVMNSIQFLLGREVHCTPSVFAYSMLYPVTDNLLDDTEISRREKQAFNAWLEQRLQGRGLRASAAHEPTARLVRVIEQEHEREHATSVYDSLLAIHQAQTQSLQQQCETENSPNTLRLSIRKGGTSVLAHGYLINPLLDAEHARFLFEYGVSLQLLDDLQDVIRDASRCHNTLFTHGLANDQLHELTARVCHFMQQTVARMPNVSGGAEQPLGEMIARNAELLMLHSVAQHHEYFPPDFLHALQTQSPLPFSALRALPSKLRLAIEHIEHSVESRHPPVELHEFLL